MNIEIIITPLNRHGSGKVTLHLTLEEAWWTLQHVLGFSVEETDTYLMKGTQSKGNGVLNIEVTVKE